MIVQLSLTDLGFWAFLAKFSVLLGFRGGGLTGIAGNSGTGTTVAATATVDISGSATNGDKIEIDVVNKEGSCKQVTFRCSFQTCAVKGNPARQTLRDGSEKN